MKLIILFTFLTIHSFAGDYKIEGKIYSFNSVNDIEVHCPGPHAKCEAAKKVKSLKDKNSRADKFGGSEYCRKKLNGQTILGVNNNQDGRAFCLFEDASLIELNSLGVSLGPK